MAESIRAFLTRSSGMLGKPHVQSAANQLLRQLGDPAHEMRWIWLNSILVEAERFALSFAPADQAQNLAQLLDTPSFIQYQPAEVLSGDQTTPTLATSLWSVGCVLWELFSGRSPFSGAGVVQTSMNVAMRKIVNKLPQDCDAETTDFLNAFFADQPQIKQLLAMPFAAGFVPGKGAILGLKAPNEEAEEAKKQRQNVPAAIGQQLEENTKQLEAEIEVKPETSQEQINFLLKNDSEKAIETSRKLYPANCSSFGMKTKLMECAEIGDTAGVLKNIAEAGAIDSFFETALLKAAYNGHVECVKLLLSEAGKVRHGGWTALMKAALNGRVECVKLLEQIPEELEASIYAGYKPQQ